MLTVLHVIARLPASGTERQLIGMLGAAHRRHWDASLCVLYPGFPLVAEVEAMGVPVVQLDGSSRLHTDRLRALRRLIAQGRYDVVHSSLWGGSAFTRAAVAGMTARPAVVVSERRVEDFRPAPARALDAVLRRWTDGYIGNSDDVGDFVRRAHRVPADLVSVIPNGIDDTVFRPRPGARPPGGRLRVGSVGRLVTQKGFDVLVGAVPELLREHPDVEVVVAGEGEERGRLEAAAAGLPVTFSGALASPSDVAAFLHTLDVFVLPSRYEGLPNVVLEARACGLPVVATQVAGMAEATQGTARLVPPEDARALAVALGRALHEARSAEGRQTTDLPTRGFESVAVDHLRAYESARARRQGSPGGRATARTAGPAERNDA